VVERCLALGAAGADTVYLQVLDLNDLAQIRLISEGVLPHFCCGAATGQWVPTDADTGSYAGAGQRREWQWCVFGPCRGEGGAAVAALCHAAGPDGRMADPFRAHHGADTGRWARNPIDVVDRWRGRGSPPGLTAILARQPFPLGRDDGTDRARRGGRGHARGDGGADDPL